jgi:O-acetyl-ADP-ribose deacetylase (regulator of RNase III)
MIKVVYGDLMQATEDIIVHQVNCKGVMGSGVAKQIKANFPEVFNEYRGHAQSHDSDELLGTAQFVFSPSKNKIVANVFGQDSFGASRRRTFESALIWGLIKVKEFAEDNNMSVAMPYNIGCALGGGDWDTVYEGIQAVFSDFDRDVVLYQFEEPSC